MQRGDEAREIARHVELGGAFAIARIVDAIFDPAAWQQRRGVEIRAEQRDVGQAIADLAEIELRLPDRAEQPRAIDRLGRVGIGAAEAGVRRDRPAAVRPARIRADQPVLVRQQRRFAADLAGRGGRRRAGQHAILDHRGAGHDPAWQVRAVRRRIGQLVIGDVQPAPQAVDVQLEPRIGLPLHRAVDADTIAVLLLERGTDRGRYQDRLAVERAIAVSVDLAVRPADPGDAVLPRGALVIDAGDQCAERAVGAGPADHA